MRGRRALSATAEVRWPVASVGRSLGHLPVGIDRVWLTLFADAGDAWNPGVPPQPTHLLGAGAEAVADLRVSYDLPLRARVGAAYPLGTLPLGRDKALTAYAAVGADF
jgi:outer membrane protein assembly factor BamA